MSKLDARQLKMDTEAQGVCLVCLVCCLLGALVMVPNGIYSCTFIRYNNYGFKILRFKTDTHIIYLYKLARRLHKHLAGRMVCYCKEHIAIIGWSKLMQLESQLGGWHGSQHSSQRCSSAAMIGPLVCSCSYSITTHAFTSVVGSALRLVNHW